MDARGHDQARGRGATLAGGDYAARAIIAPAINLRFELDARVVRRSPWANAMLLHLTIDHQVIFSWALRRGAHPSTFVGDEHPWPLLFNFGSVGAGLKEINWDKFFAEFERADLAFVYRDASPNGQLDDWHEFVKRAAVPELTISGRSTITEEVM